METGTAPMGFCEKLFCALHLNPSFRPLRRLGPRRQEKTDVAAAAPPVAGHSDNGSQEGQGQVNGRGSEPPLQLTAPPAPPSENLSTLKSEAPQTSAAADPGKRRKRTLKLRSKSGLE